MQKGLDVLTADVQLIREDLDRDARNVLLQLLKTPDPVPEFRERELYVSVIKLALVIIANGEVVKHSHQFISY